MTNFGTRREPFTLSTLWSRLKAAEKRIEEVASSTSTVGRAAVEAGKSLLIRGGGSIVVQDAGDVDVEGGSVRVRNGGGVTVEDGGQIIALWDNGNIATYFGPLATGALAQWRGFYVAHEDDTAKPILDAARLPAGVDPAFPGGRSVFAAGEVGVGGPLFALDEFSVSTQEMWLQFPRTTGASPNMVVDASTGLLARSTSSRRYKMSIADAEVDPAVVLAMRPRTWLDRDPLAETLPTGIDTATDTAASETTAQREPRRYVGFVAEELDELGGGLEQFVIYDDQGRPDAIDYDRLSVALLTALQDVAARVKTLEGDA